MALPSSYEELRRKHIQTLEVCQRLVNENAELRKSGGIGDGTAALQADIQKLRETIATTLQENTALQAKCTASEARQVELAAALETARIKAVQAEAKCASMQQAPQQPKQHLSSLHEEVACQTIVPMMEHKAVTTIPGCSESEANDEAASRHRETEAHRLSQGTAEDEAAKRAQHELERVRLENVALQAEVVRLSTSLRHLNDAPAPESSSVQSPQACTQGTQTPAHPADDSKDQASETPPAAALGAPSSLPRAQKITLKQPARVSGDGSNGQMQDQKQISKANFAELVKLRKENYLLRRQFADLKNTSGKALMLTRRSTPGF